MLDLSTAVLCDFAQVRDRLLFVSSGAVSRLYRQELPSPLGLMVGLVIEVPLEDAGMEHRLRAEVINRHGTVLATLENLFRVSDAGLFPHEVQQVPLVLSITGVRARTWGTHQVRLYLDDDLVRALTLYVVPAAGPQAVVRATPTQSRVADDEGSLGGTGTDGVDAPRRRRGPARRRRPGPAPALGAPVGAPRSAPSRPSPTEADGGHEIVIDLATPTTAPSSSRSCPRRARATPGIGARRRDDAHPGPHRVPDARASGLGRSGAPARPAAASWDTPAPPPTPAPAPWDKPPPPPAERSPWEPTAPEAAPEPPAGARAQPRPWEPPSPAPAPAPRSGWRAEPGAEPVPCLGGPAPAPRPGQPSIAAPRAEERAPRCSTSTRTTSTPIPAQRTRPVPATPSRRRAGEEPLLVPVPLRRGRRHPELSEPRCGTPRASAGQVEGGVGHVRGDAGQQDGGRALGPDEHQLQHRAVPGQAQLADRRWP